MPSIFDEIIQEKTGEVPSEKNDIDEDGAEENDTKGINIILQMIKGKTDINISTDSLPEINIPEIKHLDQNNDKNEEHEPLVPGSEEAMPYAANSYENILKEIQEHEASMAVAIKNADELAGAVKDNVMYYLNIRKANRNGILFHGVPDVLNASAKLLDLSINGRYKLASMKKLRASIIKDMTSSEKSNNKNELNLALLLSEN